MCVCVCVCVCVWLCVCLMLVASGRTAATDAVAAERNWQTSVRQRQALRENQVPTRIFRRQGFSFLFSEYSCHYVAALAQQASGLTSCSVLCDRMGILRHIRTQPDWKWIWESGSVKVKRKSEVLVVTQWCHLWLRLFHTKGPASVVTCTLTLLICLSELWAVLFLVALTLLVGWQEGHLPCTKLLFQQFTKVLRIHLWRTQPT